MFTRRLRKAYFAQTVIRFPKMFLSIVTNFHPVQSKEDHFCIKMFYRQLPFLSFVLIVGSMSKFCLVIYPAGIYLLKVNYRTTRTRCEICLKLIIKIPERCQWRRSGIFIVNFELISNLILVFLLLTLNM